MAQRSQAGLAVDSLAARSPRCLARARADSVAAGVVAAVAGSVVVAAVASSAEAGSAAAG